MSYLQTIKYDPSADKLLRKESDSLVPKGEEIEIITVVTQINIAVVQDKDGNVFEISADMIK